MPKQSTAGRLFGYALVYKFRIIGALLILCCAVGAELGGPFIIKTIIDKHLSAGGEDLLPVLGLLALYMGLLLVASIGNFSQAYMLQSTALQIIKNMRMDLMRHIHLENNILFARMKCRVNQNSCSL